MSRMLMSYLSQKWSKKASCTAINLVSLQTNYHKIQSFFRKDKEM